VAMAPTRIVLLFGAIAVFCVAKDSVAPTTPVGKVVKMLEDLITATEAEGKQEATGYDQFACFCKTTTDAKSNAITSGHDAIKTESSTIAAKTASKEEEEAHLKQLVEDQSEMSNRLQELTLTHGKNEGEYNSHSQDVSKAISSLESAIQSMETSKPASFLAVREKVKREVVLAGVRSMISEPQQQAFDAFLQVDPKDPVFKYHSQGIIDVLNGMLKSFRENQQQLDSEWGKTVQTFNGLSSSLNAKLGQTASEIKVLQGTTLPKLTSEIASARSSLLSAEASLKDDQLYLKDLTAMCETRAQDWDQRSALRRDELSSLKKAVQVLSNEVVGRDAQYNQRAMLLQRKSGSVRLGVVSHSAPTLLQEVSTQSLDQSRGANMETSTASSAKVSAYLRSESSRLQSTVLSSMAVHVDADPFGQVKTLVQKLIERLIRESTAEATKKGYCDEQLGVAYKDRDFRLEETQDLNMDLEQLELKRDELDAEISMLTGALQKLREDLKMAGMNRVAEQRSNQEVIRESKEGLKGTQEAMTILKVFYTQAAKATVFQQASPVDEDTSGAGFAGAYTGQQESSKAIIGLLEVILSDFDRTIRVTEAAEQKSQAEFVEFERASLADISGKEQKKTLDDEDLVTTKDTLKQKMGDLQRAQDLLDNALQTLAKLKPTCIDTGMSYAARVEKREEEIDALKRALCMLDPDDVESSCNRQQPQR